MTTTSTTTRAPAGLRLRRADERGRTRLAWLDGRHSFSFGRYVDRAHTGFRALRVINDDRVSAGAGFSPHPHENMEIVTYVVSGRLAHKDSLGNASEIGPGEVQRMTAGRGIVHSEFNPSATEPTRLLQIWIEPGARDLDPGYEQKDFGVGGRPGELVALVTPDGREGSLRIHQDASIFAAVVGPGRSARHEPGAGRHTWVQVVRGDLRVNGLAVGEGDGVAVEPGVSLSFESDSEAEVLVFDLA